MDPLQFKITALSPGSAVQSQDSSDEASDERTSFIRSAKSQRKYGSTTSSRMNATSPIKYYQAPHQNPSAFIQHRVEPTDTLMGIALRYQTTVENIKRINKLWSNDSLFLKETLLVPSTEAVQDQRSSLFLVEDEVNGTAFPTLEASCSEVHLTESLNALTLRPTTSLTSTSSSSSNDVPIPDTSLQDYLGSIDSQINEAKSKAQALQKTSDVLKDHPDLSGQSSWSRGQQYQFSVSPRLRLSLTDLGPEFNAATNSSDLLPSTAIVGGNGGSRKSAKSLFSQKETPRDEIFEL